MSTGHEHRRVVSDAELVAPLMPYDEAVTRIAAAFEPLPPVELPLAEALGLVLASDVVAQDDVPCFDNSAMDGYAVRAADVAGGAALAVGDRVGPGVAVKVMTGQPIPDGADAVVPWEATVADRDGARVTVAGPVDVGRFVRPRGEDVRAGTTVLVAGRRLGAVEVGMAAALGVAELAVHPRPRVGVLSTGDELVGVGEPVSKGRVRDANGPLLAATIMALGGEVSGVRRAPDDPEQITEALHDLAAVSDLVVSSGGASVGEKDWLRVVLERSGRLGFWRIAMRPGKPVGLGSLDGTPVVVLPGNPGSVVACSHVVLGRALRVMGGAPAEPRRVEARLASDVAGDAERTLIHPVALDGGVAVPSALRSSQVLSSALGADGWLVLPPGGAAAGTTVQVELA